MDCSNYFVCTACKNQDIDIEEEFFPKPKTTCTPTYARNLISFFVFGLVNNFAYVIFLTGADDILNNRYPTSVVLLSEMLPILIAQGVAPLFIEYMPFWIRLIFLSLSTTGAFVLMASTNNAIVSIVGIVIASLSSGFGEITYMGLSAGYDKNTVSLYSSGTGGAGVFGAFTYLALSSWLKLDVSTILYICSPVPLLMALFYFVVLSEKDKPDSLVTNDMHEESPQTESELPFLPQSDPDSQSLGFTHKLHLQLKLFKYTGPLFVVYFAEYMINQGIFPACTFPENLSFSTQEYKYYQFLYQIGVFISRSSVNVIQIKALWFLAAWQVINMAIFWTNAYFNYVPSIYILFALVIYEGLVGGAVYVNAFYLVSEEIKGPIKEFCMSSISVWYSCGILLSGVAALFVQPWLQTRREESYFIPLYNYSNTSL